MIFNMCNLSAHRRGGDEGKGRGGKRGEGEFRAGNGDIKKGKGKGVKTANVILKRFHILIYSVNKNKELKKNG